MRGLVRVFFDFFAKPKDKLVKCFIGTPATVAFLFQTPEIISSLVKIFPSFSIKNLKAQIPKLLVRRISLFRQRLSYLYFYQS